MARHKFENQFKKKLERRAIEPSSDSWEQLAKKLDAEDKKTSPAFWWIGIAATIAGGILIFSLIFNNTPVTEIEVVVDPPSEKIIDDPDKHPAEKQEIASEEAEKSIISANNAEKSKKPQTSDISNINSTDLATVVIDDERGKSNEGENQTISGIIEEDAFSEKLEEVIAEITMKEKDSGEATDAEIEALLSKAAIELSREQNRNYIGDNNINANELLRDVEMELENSFREKVFEVLKDGYLKARTAVANRNY